MMAITKRGYKPLNGKAYGSIPHLPGSRLGPGDHRCSETMAQLATGERRDKHYRVWVTEKLDGSCVSILRKDGLLLPLVRSGYLATSSPYEQHWHFHNWVMAHQGRFLDLLKEDGDRVVGEWIMQAHGTRYRLTKSPCHPWMGQEPWAAFDLFDGNERVCHPEAREQIKEAGFLVPRLLNEREPMTSEVAMAALDKHTGFPEAQDPREGCVWRVEHNDLIDPGRRRDREWKFKFLVKYVRSGKEDGKYLPEMSGEEPVWNWYPSKTWGYAA